MCDGENHAQCTYPPSGTTCATASCSDGEALSSECDGAGSCEENPPQQCGAYRCGDTACLTECSSNDDCASGYACDTDEGECTPIGAQCIDDVTLELPNGETQDCTPFACNRVDCHSTCSSASQCAPNHRCTADGNCVPIEDDEGGSNDDGGCGCRAAGTPPSGRLGALGLLLGLGLLASRRRRHRRTR